MQQAAKGEKRTKRKKEKKVHSEIRGHTHEHILHNTHVLNSESRVQLKTDEQRYYACSFALSVSLFAADKIKGETRFL